MEKIIISIALVAAALMLFPNTADAAKIQLSGGGEMYYEDTGEGEPVILLHGYSLDRRMWNGQVKALSGKYRVIVPDMRGHGLSADPQAGYQFTYMDDVVALMDSLGIAKAHVVGLSMGGFIAGDMLGMCPERLLSCVMVSGETINSSGPSTPRTAKEKARLKASGDKVRKNLAAYRKRRINVLRGACCVWNDTVRDECTREVMEWGCWPAMNVTCRLYYACEAMSRLRANKPEVPSLIIYGDKEKTTDSRLLRYLPNSRQVIFEHCGHMVNLEYPAKFNETLLQWLEEVKIGQMAKKSTEP